MSAYIKTALLLLMLQITASQSAKNNARPVYEVINESRIDEKKPSNAPGILPYGNPLAGNSLQNAKLYAQNQQAMFNAEKIRQHRAQIQRWTQTNQQTDSYMRAYHESQESHQLALEQQQSSLKDKKAPVNKHRQETIKKIKSPDVTKITKEDAVVKPERNRNHRSHGSVEYQQYLQSYLQPRRYKAVYVSPGPTYDQGVTIKPNGISYLDTKEPSKLYTEAVASKTQYIYPKLHTQMNSYESAQDIQALNELLLKAPQQQLNELNAMIESNNQNKDTLETPIDLYFYSKEHKSNQNYGSLYGRNPQTYANSFTQEPEIRDHTPITEDIDDIENPNKHSTITAYGLQTVITPKMPNDESSTKSNYFNVAGQNVDPAIVYVSDKPTFQALNYEPEYSIQSTNNDGDSSERYLHHNLEHKGVHHLTPDGDGVSAYGDENVSILIRNRNRRSTLDTEPFIIGSEVDTSTKIKNETLPYAEEIKRNPHSKRRPLFKQFDYDYDYEVELTKIKKVPKHDLSYDEDDDDDYIMDDHDMIDADYEYGGPNYKKPTFVVVPQRGIENLDTKGSFSHNHNNHSPYLGSFANLNDFATSYGVPFEVYSPSFNTPANDDAHSLGSLEPVYMLTESQLKRLLNNHSLNIQQLDVFQRGKGRKRGYRLRRYRKKHRSPLVPRKLKENLYKLHKLALFR